MILIVNLNPAIDVNLFGEKFQVYGENRGEACFPEPGGKGINAARVANRLGSEVVVTGLLGGFTGKFIEEELQKQGLQTDFLPISGTTRISLSHIERDSARETKIVPFSPPLEPETADDFCRHLERIFRSRHFSIAAFCGTLPADLDTGYYVRLMQIAENYCVPVVIDTSGQALVKAVRFAPFMIKPNLPEAKEFTGSDNLEDIFETFRNLSRMVKVIAFSMGEEGAAFFSEGNVVKVYAKGCTAINPVGAGDAFVGGFLAAYERYGPDCKDTLYRWAVAAGTSTASSPGLLWDKNLFTSILENLDTEEKTPDF